MINTGSMRIALYPRVSTLEQARDGYSINEQIERMKKYCEAHDWVVSKIYTDAGYSGGDTDRPGLQELIRDAENHRIDAVLVYKLDRLSRSQKDTLTLIEDVFLPNGVNFISMTENFDTSTPFGRAMLGILSVFAQLEREQIKERLEIGKIGRAKKGKWCGSPNIPIGYDLDGDDLVVNEYEAMQVQEMFRLFNLRISQRRIAKMLHSKGYTYQSGGTWAGKHYIRPMLENKHYIGMVSYKGEWYEGNQDPIIDMATFNKAQDILAEHDADHTKRSKRGTSLLSGLVHCGHCNSKYFSRRVVDKYSGPLNYYTCYRRSANTGKWKDIPKEERCKNKIWKSNALEENILGEIRKLSLEPDSFVAEPRGDESATQIQIIESRITEVEKKISKLMDLYSIGGMDFNVVQEKITLLVAEKEGLQITLRNLEVKDDKISKEEAVEIASSLCEVIDEETTDELQFLIRELIEKIVIDGEDIHIYWKFA